MGLIMRRNWKVAAAGALVLAAGVPVGISVAGPAGDKVVPLSVEQKVGVAQTAFPSLAEVPVGTTAPMDHPAAASATLTRPGAKPIAIFATDDGYACLTADGTSTCSDAVDAAETGLFVAALDCQARTAHVTGVLPAGVSGVAPAGGGAEAKGTKQGVVDFETPLALLTGLRLSNGGTGPLSGIQRACDAPTQPAG